MRRYSKVVLSIAGVSVLLVACSVPAAEAQEASAAPSESQGAQPVSQGPLDVERVPSGWVVSPDMSVTEVNKQYATVAGIFGGWLTDRTWLVGAGGYWLANRADDFNMAYGGLVMQYRVRSDRRIGFGVKGLVGGGDATIAATYQDVYGTPIDRSRAVVFGRSHRPGRPAGGGPPPQTITPTTRLAFNEVFFIAEPQAQVFWNVSSRVRLTFGAGYRVTSGADRVNDRLRGPIGSVSVEFGGGH
jgi:hypothetical protein